MKSGQSILKVCNAKMFTDHMCAASKDVNVS